MRSPNPTVETQEAATMEWFVGESASRLPLGWDCVELSLTTEWNVVESVLIGEGFQEQSLQFHSFDGCCCLLEDCCYLRWRGSVALHFQQYRGLGVPMPEKVIGFVPPWYSPF